VKVDIPGFFSAATTRSAAWLRLTPDSAPTVGTRIMIWRADASP
jgi:hypothetical protein